MSGPERHAARVHALTDGLEVRRPLPTARRRSVGAWCFVDHFGPSAGGGFDVSPHPHIGLQTVTWLLQGELLHTDSLGYRQWVRPGQVNWMTSGRGISHAEHAPPDGGPMHGVQLWVALPEAERGRAPSFVHHPEVPVAGGPGWRAQVLCGVLGGSRGPAETATALLGADVEVDGEAVIGVDEAFEHGVVVVEGEAEVDGERFARGELGYLAPGRGRLTLRGERARLMLLGGPPFPDPLLIWWNFVGSDPAELREARTAWQAGDARFGVVTGAARPRLDAPELPEPWR